MTKPPDPGDPLTPRTSELIHDTITTVAQMDTLVVADARQRLAGLGWGVIGLSSETVTGSFDRRFPLYLEQITRYVLPLRAVSEGVSAHQAWLSELLPHQRCHTGIPRAHG